jgi:hypothetical protein
MVLAGIMLLIGSCGPKEQYYYVSYTILNKSDHKIELFIFRHNNTIDTIMLPTHGSDTVIETRQEGRASDPPPFVTDSVRVTYDDSISIVHFRTAEQDASRSIIRSESWTGGSTGDQEYKWEYLFTNDDYEEAVSLQ